MGSVIEVAREGPVARVWLNRPDQHNALAPALLAGIVSSFHELAHEDAIRVVVLGGRGASFCAGADINTMKASSQASYADNLAEAEKLAHLFAAVADFPKPVVGRIHGSVYGGGVGLTCCCDIPVASDEARFGLTEVRLGILPSVISPYVVRRLGDRAARELMLTGERFGAQVAMAYGMVSHVVPLAELDGKVDERVQALLMGGPLAQRRIKTALQLYGDTTWEEYRAQTPRTLAEVRGTDEARDGLAAFFEKRKPKWIDGA